MQHYLNLGGDSNVLEYEVGIDYVVVRFKGHGTTHYKYTNSSAGQSTVSDMKNLAMGGHGLGSYIHRCKPAYSDKW